MLNDNLKTITKTLAAVSSLNEKMSAEDADKLRKKIQEKLDGKPDGKKNKKSKKKKSDENQNEVPAEETENKVLPKPVVKVQKREDFSVENMTAEKLKNAVVWSEILGEPACKRRRGRKR